MDTIDDNSGRLGASPCPTQAQFDAARLRVQDAIEDLDLSRRMRLCLREIRRRSFDLGRTRAYIPTLALIVEATGLAKSEASQGMADLRKIRAIIERPKGWYGINVTFDAWAVDWPKLRQRAEQAWLGLEEPPDLDEALRRSFVEMGGSGVSQPAREDTPADRGVPTAGGILTGASQEVESVADMEVFGKSERCSENPNGVRKIRTTAVSTRLAAGAMRVVRKIRTVPRRRGSPPLVPPFLKR